MKLIYLTAMLPYGAQEAFLIPEADEILRQGHRPLIVPRSPRAELVHADAGPLQDVALRRPLLAPEILRASLRMIRRRPRWVSAALALLRGGRGSVLLRNLAVFPKALWLAEVALRQGVQHVHAHWALTTATMAMVASEVSGIPWSFTAHRGDIVDNNLLATKARHAAFVRVISQSGLRLLEATAGKEAAEKAVVIHMGVPIPEEVDRARARRWPATLLCPANLLPVKGHGYLLQAVALLKARGWSGRVELAGEGPVRSALDNQAQTLGITDRVTLLGHVPHDAILARYRGGRVGAVVLPSVDLGGGVHEGIPVALIEAMSYGVPTISTTTGGIPELLQDGAGILVPPANPEALANAVGLLAGDPALRARLAEAGRARVKEQYSIERVVAALAGHWAASASKRLPASGRLSESRPFRQAA